MKKDEALKLAQDWYDSGHEDPDEFVEMIKQVIALAEQPAQQKEPVAAIRALTNQCAALIQERDELQKQVWRYEKNGVTCQTYRHKIDRTCSECNVQEDYTSPQPSKPWVGLTDEERRACTQSPFAVENYLSIEAKLKERNT